MGVERIRMVPQSRMLFIVSKSTVNRPVLGPDGDSAGSGVVPQAMDYDHLAAPSPGMRIGVIPRERSA